jgi:hypothetical protein
MAAPQGGETDISPAEREEIVAQIDEHVARSRTPLSPDRLAYRALRSGAWLPILVNLAAVAMIVVGLFTIPALFRSRGERSAASGRTAPSGEASLVGAVKAEGEEQIEGMQERLSRAGQELLAARASRDAEIAKREAQLRSTLAAELAAERAKLAKSGVAAASAEAQLAALSDRRGAELAQELERLRAQRDSELAKQERDQEAAAAELAALRERSQSESLALDQLTAAYGGIADAVRAEHWGDALAKLESAQSFLSQPAVAALPAIQHRTAVDAFLLGSLRQLVGYRSGAAAEGAAEAGFRQGIADLTALQDRSAQPLLDKADILARQGDFDGAIDSYATMIEQYPVSSLLARALQGLRRAADAKVRRAQDEAAARGRAAAGVQAKVAAASSGLAAAGRRETSSAAASQQELIALLQAKVLVKEALSAESVRAAHPGLSDSLDRYIEVYSEQKRSDGRAAALADVSIVADYILGKRGAGELAQVWGRSADPAQRAAMQQVLDRLKLLVQ